ncbi:hypothetical protein P3T36_000984 [Kitasatospora sp. MAP12-15]|uniref:protein kinase domain-containing protein n=1 Tax=unclassified Kitasatospora TaxID=2633591 RepID=UPI002476F479|nr:protein kinase [Kitasatospora sp. MAP12-44]MDH6114585.1 hypothetical protein [Kitasatospora sp. MAP12-44]
MTVFVDPFAGDYFAAALHTARSLGRARASERIGQYEIIGELAGPHATIKVGRRGDGRLTALKGFRSEAAVTALRLATRQNEALRMIQYGYGGLLPIEESVSRFTGGSITYLCMPYCQGGSLRDRMAAGGVSGGISGGIPVAELAYHALAVACAMARLHGHGMVHGDIKPENILFGHHGDEILGRPASWQTWLCDLETMAATGRPTSSRMTPAYAAPEQGAGALAAPAMDVWAWGASIRDGLAAAGPARAEWQWLRDLVERALAAVPADRPGAQEIIDTFARHLAFGDQRGAAIGAGAGAVARYPLDSMPALLDSFARRADVHLVTASLGWAAWLPECGRLYQLQTVPALLRIEELSGRVLGDPADPSSAWAALRRRPKSATVPAGAGAGVTIGQLSSAIGHSTETSSMPRGVALTFVRHLTTALVELVEKTGGRAELERLDAVTRAWESLGEFAADADQAILAQAWLSLDDLERALPHIRRSYTAAPTNPSARAAMRLYYLLTGDSATAAKVALQPDPSQDGALVVRWLTLALRDLLEAGDLKELGALLDLLPDSRIDTVELIRCVWAGRLGRLRSDPEWPGLREHFSTVAGTISVQTLRYLVEAAYQRGELDYARRRAAVGRTLPAIRLPVNHQDRAAIEAVALGRDPAERGLTARLENRAELWAADGRPEDDPLTGMSLEAAQRWVDGAGRTAVRAEARELVRRSGLLLADRAELRRSERHCAACRTGRPVSELAVCGACHQVFCSRCANPAKPGRRCSCGGDLAHP